MPKGEIVGIFIMGRQKAEYLFVIDGKLSPTMTNKRKWQDQQHNVDRMTRSGNNSILEFQIPGFGGVKS
jgi:hypothetical protein